MLFYGWKRYSGLFNVFQAEDHCYQQKVRPDQNRTGHPLLLVLIVQYLQAGALTLSYWSETILVLFDCNVHNFIPLKI